MNEIPIVELLIPAPEPDLPFDHRRALQLLSHAVRTRVPSARYATYEFVIHPARR